MSIELSLEDVKKVAFSYGFELEVNSRFVTVFVDTFSIYCMAGNFIVLFYRRKKPLRQHTPLIEDP